MPRPTAAPAPAWELHAAQSPQQLQQHQQVEMLEEEDLMQEQQEGLAPGQHQVAAGQGQGPGGSDGVQQALKALHAALLARLPQDLRGLHPTRLATAAAAVQRMRVYDPALLQVGRTAG
jgi:hypothetical protein